MLSSKKTEEDSSMPENTLLINAVLVGDVKDVLRLATIETINIKGNLGKTALQYAVLSKYSCDVIICTLLQRGADVNMIDDVGHSALSDAGKGSRAIDDVYAHRACFLIGKGALWPKTELGNLAWEKLPGEVQRLFIKKLREHQDNQARADTEEKTKAFGMLSGFASFIHKNRASWNTERFIS